MTAPAVVVLGGPNGAGKSTAAPRLLRESLKVEDLPYDGSSLRVRA